MCVCRIEWTVIKQEMSIIYKDNIKELLSLFRRSLDTLKVAYLLYFHQLEFEIPDILNIIYHYYD